MLKGIRVESGEVVAYWDFGALFGWFFYFGRLLKVELVGSSNVWVYLG